VEILEEYKRVRPGEEVKANVTINNLKDIDPTNLNLYIAIKDLRGNIYDSLQEEIPFPNTVSLERSLVTSPNSREGEYLFYARVSNEESLAIDSDIFQIGIRFNFAAFLKSSFIFLLIAFLSIFAVILMLKYHKEREKERILSLYLMVNELKSMIKEGKFDSAVNLYIRIKAAYGEPVSKSALDNKEKLKEEVRKLSQKLKAEVKAIKSEEKNEEKPEKQAFKKTLAKKKQSDKEQPQKAVQKPIKPVGTKPVTQSKTEAKPVAKPAEKTSQSVKQPPPKNEV
jgi:hypothetical protein